MKGNAMTTTALLQQQQQLMKAIVWFNKFIWQVWQDQFNEFKFDSTRKNNTALLLLQQQITKAMMGCSIWQVWWAWFDDFDKFNLMSSSLILMMMNEHERVIIQNTN